jgi:hypothetical protein
MKIMGDACIVTMEGLRMKGSAAENADFPVVES